MTHVHTITCHDARQHECSCDICGNDEDNIVQVQDVQGSDQIWICQGCVHRMYVKCAAAFNIRPKLW
jgi:hypothetical protein